MDRQRRKIGIVAGQHDLLGRRLGLCDLDDVRLAAQPPLDFPKQFAGRNADGARDPRPAAGDAANQFLALRANGAKQHGARIAFECFGDVGEVNRLLARFEFAAFGEAFDEPTQPEAIRIGKLRRIRGRGTGVDLIDDIHALAPLRGL